MWEIRVSVPSVKIQAQCCVCISVCVRACMCMLTSVCVCGLILMDNGTTQLHVAIKLNAVKVLRI